MKTIEEAAKDYSKSKSSAEVFRCAHETDFKAGVEFAQRWISVEDELPETIYDEKIFLKYPILVKNIDGALQVLNTFSDISTYTHWRPIELK